MLSEKPRKLAFSTISTLGTLMTNTFIEDLLLLGMVVGGLSCLFLAGGAIHWVGKTLWDIWQDAKRWRKDVQIPCDNHPAFLRRQGD